MAKEANTSCWRVHFGDVLKCEFSLFKKESLLIVATAILILVPSIYTGTYAWGVWDPYGNLTNLPADVGMDLSSAVGLDYKPPFKFSGTINKILIDIEK